MTRVCTAALDHAAGLIAAALGIERVGRDPIGPDEPEGEYGEDVALVVALSEADLVEGEYLMGAATPYEFSMPATLDVIVVGGSREQRLALRGEAIIAAAAAIAADPTLGGLVDFAEVESPDVTTGERSAGVQATLTLTYSAPTALG